jgi:predicted nucleic acid-binding protein
MSNKNLIDSNIWLYALLDSKGDKRHQEAVSFLKDRDVHVISS